MMKRLRTAMRSCSFWARAHSVSRLRFLSERLVNDGVRRVRERRMKVDAMECQIQDPQMALVELIVDSDWQSLPFLCGRYTPYPACIVDECRINCLRLNGKVLYRRPRTEPKKDQTLTILWLSRKSGWCVHVQRSPPRIKLRFLSCMCGKQVCHPFADRLRC
jgi:hypothetical protein